MENCGELNDDDDDGDGDEGLKGRRRVESQRRD